MLIFENVKSVCEKKGISIARLEREAGLPNGTIGKWKTSSPRVCNLQAVAKVLKVKIETLLKE